MNDDMHVIHNHDDNPPSGAAADVEDTSDANLMGDETTKHTAVVKNVDPQKSSAATTTQIDQLAHDEDIDSTDTPLQVSVDGEESMSGSAAATTSDDDVGEAMEEVIGNEPESGKPFSLDEEITKDELERRGMDPKDYGYGDDGENED